MNILYSYFKMVTELLYLPRIVNKCSLITLLDFK